MSQPFFTLETIRLGEVTFRDAGLSFDSATITLAAQRPDVFSAIAAARLDSQSLFGTEEVIVAGNPQHLGELITVRSGRTRPSANAAWSSGRILFQGRFLHHAASYRSEHSLAYQFIGPWDYFEKHKFRQHWRDGVSGAFVPTTHVRLPTRLVLNGSGRYVEEYITNGQQIAEVVSYLNSLYAEPVMQIGTISPALQIPLDEKNAGLTCAEVIRHMLELSPDAVPCFDYSTTPPTFNVWDRTSLQKFDVPMSDGEIAALELTRRDDMVREFVRIVFERVDSVDGLAAPSYLIDAAPLGTTGAEYNAVDETVNLAGFSKMHERQVIETIPIPNLGNIQFWIAQGYKWLDANAPTPGVKDVVITPIAREGDQPNILIGGGIKHWMLDKDDPDPEPETLRARVSYTLLNSAGESVGKVENKEINLKVMTTVLTGGTFKRIISTTSAEPTPVGLAAALRASLIKPFWEGEVTLLNLSSEITLRHVLNFPGGTGKFADIDAIAQSITYNLGPRTIKVRLGAPEELGLDARLTLFRTLRTRRTWSAPNVQGSGEFDDDSDLAGDEWLPIEDASSAGNASGGGQNTWG
jgi:hypothetical protein